jgi:hypothetical protein
MMARATRLNSACRLERQDESLCLNFHVVGVAPGIIILSTRVTSALLVRGLPSQVDSIVSALLSLSLERNGDISG